MTMKDKINQMVRNFHPAWYATVMGTGGLANAVYLFLGKIPFFEKVAQALVLFNIALFVILIFPWVARWIWHRDILVEDMKNPLLGNFFVTMPVGMVVLGSNLYLIGPKMFTQAFIHLAGLVLFICGAPLIFFFTIAILYYAYTREALSPDHINFSWFITPVADIVVPILGTPIAAHYLSSAYATAKIITIVDIIFYGIGFMLFLFVGSVVFHRFINHKLPHPQVSPTFWIILGPIGIGVVGLFNIADALQSLGMLTETGTLKVFGAILWGFGFWAFLQTVVLTIRYWKEGVPFSMSWWAYIFPFAVYTISTFVISTFFQSDAVYWYGVGLLVMLAVMWFIVLIRSLLSLKVLLFPPAPKPTATKSMFQKWLMELHAGTEHEKPREHMSVSNEIPSKSQENTRTAEQK
jgi:C4-dicarboxylate transporter/malic acid transport protein